MPLVQVTSLVEVGNVPVEKEDAFVRLVEPLITLTCVLAAAATPGKKKITRINNVKESIRAAKKELNLMTDLPDVFGQRSILFIIQYSDGFNLDLRVSVALPARFP